LKDENILDPLKYNIELENNVHPKEDKKLSDYNLKEFCLINFASKLIPLNV
jgi:hypothetical protein